MNWGMIPILNVVGVAIISLTILGDSRSRVIINWLVFPLLFEGALVFWFINKAS